ncbi:MAG: hypothetical protein H6976_04145 [Gammaproteobacteria bacterium]|nr:hypothetical protein [Gammaproteobacteria bacterium]
MVVPFCKSVQSSGTSRQCIADDAAFQSSPPGQGIPSALIQAARHYGHPASLGVAKPDPDG